MTSPSSPRPPLSSENSDRLQRALDLSRELQSAPSAGDDKLGELRKVLKGCREGIRAQRPDHSPYRLKAVDQARNYLHFLPGMDHPEASGRLRSVSRRLRMALRTA